MSSKKTSINKQNYQKQTQIKQISSDDKSIVWKFDKIDRSGKFAFDVNRKDFCHKEFLDKMIAFSNNTWKKIRTFTHDNNKSKHHFLPYENLSKEAQSRFYSLQLMEFSDCIFSFAFNSTLRIVGVRTNEEFHVIWFDPNHEICISNKKHT